METARLELAQEIDRNKYVETVIAPQIEITEQALRGFYDQNLERMKQPERVKLRHILVQVAADASESERALARGRADELLAKARAAEDFATLARQSSDDETRDQGGELPWIQRGQTLPAFEQAAFALQAGSISEVVETPLGFHIIQAVDRQAPRTAELDEVKDRIRAVLQTQEVQARLARAIEEMMQQASIERFGL
jgi:parvulin-like peptidyl-prolyl isomerase